MILAYRPPEPLAEHHDLVGFISRSVEQSDWLRRYARQSAGTGTTKVLVINEVGSDQVVAYYAWCMAQITVADAPPRMCKGGGRYPRPVALLARLGVHTDHEGRAWGPGSYRMCSPGSSDYISSRKPSPADPLHLVLLMKDIRRALSRERGGATDDVSVKDLTIFADTFRDLADSDVMRQAWA